jgi:hypothetical protein
MNRKPALDRLLVIVLVQFYHRTYFGFIKQLLDPQIIRKNVRSAPTWMNSYLIDCNHHFLLIFRSVVPHLCPSSVDFLTKQHSRTLRA